MVRKDKHTKVHKNKPLTPQTGRYTIFHALFEAMKDKDSKHKNIG